MNRLWRSQNGLFSALGRRLGHFRPKADPEWIGMRSISRRNVRHASSGTKPPQKTLGILWGYGPVYICGGLLLYYTIWPDGHHSTMPLSRMTTVRFNTLKSNIDGAIIEFRDFLLDDEQINRDLGARISHSSTEWSEAPRGKLDRYDVIVCPKTTEEVSSIAKVCHKRHIPMTAFSGGTSLEGTLAATNGGVCIDFKNMNRIVTVRKDDLDVTVQPGVSYTDLNDHIASQDLYFPPDPGPGAQIGGMIAQNCSGTNAYRYGTMKDWVLGLTLVLADGTIVTTRHRPRKSSSGYDLTRLIVGSEGTLAFVTEAHLKVTSKPKNERVAIASFPSTLHAVQTAVKIVQNDIPLAAMELLCDVAMKAVNMGGYCSKTFPEEPTLFFKFAGPDQQALQRQIETVQKLAKQSSCDKFEFSTSDTEREEIWAARKTVLWSMMALKHNPSDKFLSADTAVPISKMGEAVDAAKQKIAESGLIGNCLGHVGDGNFHTSVFYNEGEKQKAREVITWVQRLAIEMGGTITGEHGVGLEYRGMVVEELGEAGVDMMRTVKLALDPRGLLNPGKLLDLKVENKRSSWW